MAINKVEYGGNTLIDITDTTATSTDVLNGEIFYNADGTRGVGSLTLPITPTEAEDMLWWSSTNIVNDISYNAGYYNVVSEPYKLGDLSAEAFIKSDSIMHYESGNYTKLDQVIDSKQDEITSSNKLDYSLISNTPTIPDISNLVYTEKITLTSNLSVNANTNTATATYTLTPRTNYTPIMVTLDNVYNGAINLWYCTISGNTISWRVRNTSSSKATGVSIIVCVLYIKSSCVAT